MKTACLALTVASSIFLALGAYAKETVLLPVQQNNCNKLINQKQSSGRSSQQGNANQSAAITSQTKAADASEAKTNDKTQIDSRKPVSTAHEHPIDIVICLDTSNSMDGLIDSAKQKIWDIVNELATAKPKPHLRVALYAYGSPKFGASKGYVHKQIDLSDDLDSVFTELSSLRTNGGDEYCARVISTATKEQSWSDGKKSMKIIVIAGNEPATQDPQLDVFSVAKTAIQKGIVINTIYCGSPESTEASDWRKLATSADGQFAAIDQDHGTVVVSTPFDKRLAELGSSINSTYLAYGKNGSYGQQQQAAADSLSMQMGASNYAARSMAKVSGQYRNSSWDLLDARAEKDFSLSKLKKEELPAEMQRMSAEEQKTYLDKKAKERADIQKQIADLNAQRSKYIQEEMKKSGKSTDKAFDAAMLRALREQAQKNGFTFEAKQ